MPSDLTDLMERAVASAPPEPHQPYDITRRAQRDQRRRTTFVAAAAALAVVAATGGVVGLTRGGPDSTPKPAGHLELDQTVDLSQAVPARSLRGYTPKAWTIPSQQRLGPGQSVPTYRAVDAAGRLLVVDEHGGTTANPLIRARLFDAPGEAAQPLQPPASPGTVGGVPVSWIPDFYGTDQLLWRPSTGALRSHNGFHLTDLQGGHDEFVPATFRVGGVTLVANADDVSQGSMWVAVPDGSGSTSGRTVSDVYRATFSGHPTKVGTSVSALDVGAGMAGWLTSRGEVFVQPATGAPPRRVRVPLDPGCRLRPAQAVPGTFAVSSAAVALTESCGSGRQATEQLLAFDLSGRPLVRVTGGLPFNLSFAGDTLLFQANELPLRYDLVTGSLSRLGAPGASSVRGMGRYVLWYDADGGHVAEFGG